MERVWRCDLVPQYAAYREEIDAAIRRVLSSGRYVLASEVSDFEAEFARYVGVDHAVAVANGTDGLTLSLVVLGVGEGDEVLTSPFTAIPTVSAIVDAGATPRFADIDPDTFLMDIESAAEAITPRVKALMPVHIFGSVLDVPRLRQACGGIPVIEDAAQAHGSRLGSRQAGSMGDLGVFSFYPTKNLGGYGDGGMVVTNDGELARRLRLARTYGMTDKDHTVAPGINSRLDEIQAAILRVKLRHLDAMNEQRSAIAEHYRKGLDPERFRPQVIPERVRSNYHVYAARVAGDRDGLIRRLETSGIQTNVYYPIPLHLQGALAHLGMEPGDLPAAERVCADVLALPMYPELPRESVERVIAAANAPGPS
jgi:dTDP-4-amino-4,6-dideoxygalactose transaminase